MSHQSCSESQRAEESDGEECVTQGPSAPTFCRARPKLDLLTMLARQWQWSKQGFKSCFLALCFSSGINVHQSFDGLSLSLKVSCNQHHVSKEQVVYERMKGNKNKQNIEHVET